MLQFTMRQLGENGERTGWQRVYYQHRNVGVNDLRGSAPLDRLRSEVCPPTEFGGVMCVNFHEGKVSLMGTGGTTLDGEELDTYHHHWIQPGRVHDLRIGFLRFETEVKDT